MRWYVAKRIAWAVLATWFALSATFVLLSMTPRSDKYMQAQQVAMQGGNASEAIEDYKQRKGLDKSLLTRYKNYMLGIVTGHWGYSEIKQQSVMKTIADAYPYSVQYVIPVSILTVLIGYTLGIYSAVNQYTKTDYVATFLAYFGLAIPNFWFAIMGILVLAVQAQNWVLLGTPVGKLPIIGWLLPIPVFYHTSIPIMNSWHGIPYPNPANIRQLVLPIVVLSTAGFASQMRYSRAQMLEYANAEFVKMARAKGAGTYRVLVLHALRAAMVPLSTILVGVVLGSLLGGSVIIEQVFQIPGLGFLLFQAVQANDVGLVLIGTLIPVFIAILGYLIQDLVYVWLDPRISYSQAQN